MYVLGEWLIKKDASGKLYYSSTENNPFFNKNQLFTVRKKVKFSKETYCYWLSKKTKTVR